MAVTPENALMLLANSDPLEMKRQWKGHRVSSRQGEMVDDDRGWRAR
jgi:hypothetical protein